MTELLEAGVEHGLDLCGSRTSVLTGRMTPGRIFGGDLVAQILQTLHAARRGDDFRALHGEQPRGRAANARACTGHDDDLAFKTHLFHGICPPYETECLMTLERV